MLYSDVYLADNAGQRARNDRADTADVAVHTGYNVALLFVCEKRMRHMLKMVVH